MKEGGAAEIGGGGWKPWTLAVILLLACWSMLSGSAGLARKWYQDSSMDASSGDFTANPDAMEMQVREHLVRLVWDRYKSNPLAEMSIFWHEAFEAAYEELDSGDETAIREIARLSAAVFTSDEVERALVAHKA